MTRLTFTMVSKVLTPEQARKEFEYARRLMPKDDEYSSVRATLETWNGREWVIDDKFEHENR